MKISIAIATYNGAEYIQEQFASFVSQTRMPDELVICDDGSSDETVAIVQRFENTAPFKVQLYRNETNLGWIKNFEQAIGLCTGDIIFLSDQDDVWFPEKIQKMVELFEENNSLQVAQCDMILTDSALNVSSITQLGVMRDNGFIEENFIFGCGTAIRRTWVAFILPFPEALHGMVGHDIWIHRLAAAMRVRYLLDKPLQYYRRHDAATTSSALSRAQRASTWMDFSLSRSKDMTESWSYEIICAENVLLRLVEMKSSLRKLCLIDRLAEAIQIQEAKIASKKKRFKFVQRTKPRRWISVLKFWIQGGYSEFRGWRSMLKDIIR